MKIFLGGGWPLRLYFTRNLPSVWMPLVEKQMIADSQFDKQHETRIGRCDLVFVVDKIHCFPAVFHIMLAVVPHVRKLNTFDFRKQNAALCATTTKKARKLLCVFRFQRFLAFLLAFSGGFGDVSGEIFHGQFTPAKFVECPGAAFY